MEIPFSSRALEFYKLLELLSRHALTDLGKELIHSIEPAVEPPDVEDRLATTKEMRDCLQFGDAVPLDSLTDPRSLLQKLQVEGQFLNPPELLKIKKLLEIARRLKTFFTARRETYPLLGRLTEGLSPLQKEESRIGEIVGDEGDILDSASPELRRIRREIQSASHHLRKKVESLARSYASQGYAQEALVTMRDGRLVIPVKDEYKNTIRGFVHDASASGQTVYIEPTETLELNNAVRTLQYREVREVERILLEMSRLLRTHRDVLVVNTTLLGEFDFIYAKGRFAQMLNGVVPAIRSDGVIMIRKGLHPLLHWKELSRPENERRAVVPLDLELGRPDRVMIISGPNAGGKTVALKTIGLFVLMTQCGLLIPSGEDSEISLFTSVLADIGDDQSIENDLSTFSSHVQNLAAMADSVGKRSLILVDELGSGTDPREGAALSVAFLRHILSQQASAVITTHHGELKAFAHETPGVSNGSMEFDQKTLTPTYVFRAGIPGSSYAFEIARRMGLDENLIRTAREVAGAESQKLDSLIADLQNRMTAHGKLVEDLNREKTRLEGLSKFYDSRAREMKQREKTLKKEWLAEKERLLKKANQEIEDVIKRVRESQADRSSIQESKSFLKKAHAELQEDHSQLEEANVEPDGFQPKRGDRVFIRGMELDGTVISEPDRHNQVNIAAGSLQIKVSVSQLRPSSTLERNTGGAKEKIDWDSEAVGQEIDLRGLTAEEALYEADKYISDAHALGFARVSLIHGKGEGILRRKINEFLKKNPRVQSFRLGSWGEGDTGVTIVELRGE